VNRPERTRLSRRGLVRTAAGLAAVGAGLGAGSAAAEPAAAVEPFHGRHQAGITTPAQRCSYFAALDVVSADRGDVVRMLRAWTEAAAAMAAGRPVAAVADAATPGADSDETLGLPPDRLTITFGFGPGLFVKDGKDRFGLAAQRPEALAELPRFHGDRLIVARSGGDLSVQACADDPLVAFHAVRQLARLGYRIASLRWAQPGFLAGFPQDKTARNLMGFKDGTANPSAADARAMAQFVWVGKEGPRWLKNGSYVVVRRIRIALDHWDRMPVAFQEQTFGRRKTSGAPLGGEREFDPVDLAATGKEGDPVIPESAHVRLAAAASNGGARILRRPYCYNDGVDFVAERWPPWQQGMAYDAGMFFVCYQRDPRMGFIRIFDRLAQFDMLNQFVTHTGGGLFACPGGIGEGEYLGQRLFETA
jgi:deferrochelatase/peroxidase EfeB